MRNGSIEPFFRALSQANPLPTTELEYTTHYEFVVAAMLSVRAPAAQVNEITRRLFAVANTPQAMLALGPKRLFEYVEPLLLHGSRTRNILDMSQLLLQKFGGVVPRSLVQIRALPGVGTATAELVLNVGFAHEAIDVDANVFRVSNRTTIAPGESLAAVQRMINEVAPEEFRMNATHWLGLHGRTTCLERVPQCWKCDVRTWCGYQYKFAAPPDPNSPHPVHLQMARRRAETPSWWAGRRDEPPND